MCNFVRRHHEKQFCEIILNLDQWFRRRCCLINISYLELWRPSCSAEQDHLCNFGMGHYGEHSCEIILNLDQWWFRRRCRSKKKFTDLKTDARRRPITIAFSSGELKMFANKYGANDINFVYTMVSVQDTLYQSQYYLKLDEI